MRPIALNSLYDGQRNLDASVTLLSPQQDTHPHEMMHGMQDGAATNNIPSLDSAPAVMSSVSNMYFPNFQDATMQYQAPYGMTEGAMDLQYMLEVNMAFSQHLGVDEASGEPLLGLGRDGRVGTLHDLPGFTPELGTLQSPSSESAVSEHAPGVGSDGCSRNESGVDYFPPAHTMLPPMVHPRSSNDSMAFDADVRSFNQRVNSTAAPGKADPCAAGFLQEQLGLLKWHIFSARLFERRLSGTKSKPRAKSKASSAPADADKVATAIDFLVKVEVVKEVLRKYVPHPYNPLKSLTHPYPASPTGQVILTRSTVLLLSGWSNTQFSYWARRAEAISVLSPLDDRLRSVAIALEGRLRGSKDFMDSHSVREGDEETDFHVTGKGLDLIIDEVKKRTGASQFLRGKHSSLDPFGSTADSDSGADGHSRLNAPAPSAPVYTPTFQALEYNHLPPTSPSAPGVNLNGRPRRPRRLSLAESIFSQRSVESKTDDSSSIAEDDGIRRMTFSISESRIYDYDSFKEDATPSPDLSGLPPSPMQTTFVTTVGSMSRPRRAATMKLAQQAVKDGRPPYHHSGSNGEMYPVSHSRLELENVPEKRSWDSSEGLVKKRTKRSDTL